MGLYQNRGLSRFRGACSGLIFGSGAWHSDGASEPQLSHRRLDRAESPFISSCSASSARSAAAAILLFTRAYALAEPSFVAPFEYTGLFWAVLFGFVMLGCASRPEHADRRRPRHCRRSVHAPLIALRSLRSG